MNDKIRTLLSEGSIIELHYWFDDNTHSMDAVVQNKCEYELLGILKEIASSLNSEIIIETEPLANGGLKRLFKIVLKEENKKAIILTTIIVSFATVLITAPIGKLSEKLIDQIFENKELIRLERENLELKNENLELENKKLKLEIESLKQKVQKNSQNLNQNILLKKRKSNFYEILESYEKVKRVSVLSGNKLNENVIQVIDERTVYRKSFKEFILVTDDLQPVELVNVIIEIISPVLKKGKYEWIGIFKGEPVHFNMKSNEFKTLVQTGKVEFKNGSSINCHLKIRRKVDNEGIEKIIGYDVIRVNHYFENDKPIETPEGRCYRQKRDADEQQLELFDDIED